jgi:hypothetical protein
MLQSVFYLQSFEWFLLLAITSIVFIILLQGLMLVVSKRLCV